MTVGKLQLSSKLFRGTICERVYKYRPVQISSASYFSGKDKNHLLCRKSGGASFISVRLIVFSRNSTPNLYDGPRFNTVRLSVRQSALSRTRHAC